MPEAEGGCGERVVDVWAASIIVHFGVTFSSKGETENFHIFGPKNSRQELAARERLQKLKLVLAKWICLWRYPSHHNSLVCYVLINSHNDFSRLLERPLVIPMRIYGSKLVCEPIVLPQ